MEEKRKYTKRSEYWDKFKSNASNNNLDELFEKNTEPNINPELVGESLYESVASRLQPSNRTATRSNNVSQNFVKGRFKNIDDGLLPFDYSRDSVDARDAIQLCQKAYFNVPAFRSTIDMLSDFADSDIYLEGGTEKSRKFINAWFKRIKIHDVKSQYFREYYRSGNVFLYRIDGKLKMQDSGQILETYGATKKNVPIPIKYMVINPTDVATKGSISFNDFQYFKVLTPYEISRLKNPQTDHEKEMYNSLPEDVQIRIKNNQASTSERLYIQLASDLLHVVFAKKQDYEPLSIPYGFTVLDDINKKLELKKIDQAISRSIENVVLLVTMGAEPDKGGVNHKALNAMQSIFKNQSVGRVLVSDYTTKADFVIPDLRKVVGPEKYEVLNRDIQEGLQNVLIGDNKYADGQLKMKIFIQRLEESRDLFIKEFLQPEIRRICKSAGMRSWPEAKLVKTDTLDNSDMTKLATRMMELGVITPEQGMKVVHTGVFPKSAEMDKAQEDFKQKREEGYYMPLVNSVNLYQEEKDGESEPEAKNKPAAIAPSGGRPIGVSNSSFSKKHIIKATQKVSEFELKAYRDFALKYGIDELDEQRRDLVSQACEAIIVSKKEGEWEEALSSVVDNIENLSDLTIDKDILDLGCKHQLDDMSAAILYHSTNF